MKMKALSLALVSSLVFAATVIPTDAEARGYRSSYKSSYKPRPRVIQRNTIIQQRTTTVVNRQSSGPSAVGSFLSGAAGAAVGAAAASMIMAPDQPPQEAPVEPVQQQLPPCDATIYNCTPKQ